MGIREWAAAGGMWRERGGPAGGGELQFERDAAERPPPCESVSETPARGCGQARRHPRAAP